MINTIKKPVSIACDMGLATEKVLFGHSRGKVKI